MKFQIGELKQLRSKLVREVIETKAILELLIEKGVISKEEYVKKVNHIKAKSQQNNPSLDLSDF